MWRELVGTRGYAAGASGTVAIPVGAFVTQIRATGDTGTVAIFGGTAIPIAGESPLQIQNFHDQMVSRTGASDIVFTGTDSYYVEYFKAGNT